MSDTNNNKPLIIGMVINSAIKPSRDEMLGIVDGIRELAPNARPRLFHATPATKPANIAAFAADGVDGLIFCGVRKKILIDFVRIMPNHPPMVLSVYRPITEDERKLLGCGGTVRLDNEAIGQQAAEFFFTHGLKNFAFFGSNVQRERIAAKIRSEAFRLTLKKQFGNRMTFSEFIEGVRCRSNDDFWEGGLKPVEDWLNSLPQPCGLFVNGDREAFALIDMCKHMGIAVPGTFEILSINNSYGFCERSRPTISSISPDHDRCAREAVEMVLALIENPNLPMEQRDVKVSAATLMERGTTFNGKKHGLVLTRAREYIQLNACKGIKVTDVAKNIGVAVRTLEMRVFETTGHNVHSMIRAIRLEKVCSLLETTDLPISRVTTDSGYRKVTSLACLFKKMYGMSMRQYRNAHRKRN